MKAISKQISIILLCMFCLAPLSIAQTSARYSYEVSKPKSLSSVLEDLNRKYGLVFSFPSSKINQVIISPGNYGPAELDSFITDLLSGTGFTYQIIDGQKVLLRPKKAQTPKTITIEGQVRDKRQQPLGFVDVVLDTLYKGTTTDAFGKFSLEVPAFAIDRNLKFQFLGFESQISTIADFIKNPSIALSESSTQLQEVVFVERIPSIEIGPIYPLAYTAKADFLIGLSASPLGSDIMRSIQMLAGISASDDLSSEVKIRGSQGDETLIVLDDIPIYKADHFYGIYGAVNGNHVNQVSLHKNNLPVSFGGKTGGMVEMTSKSHVQETSGILDINMLTSSITLSAPMGDKAGIILSGRTTYDNAADSKIFNWVDPSPEENIVNNSIEENERPLLLETSPVIQFYDINAKVYLRPAEDHLVSLSFFNSMDKYENEYDFSFTNELRLGQVQGREAFSDFDKWQNLGTALSYEGQLSSDWSMNAKLYYTMFDTESALETSLSLTRNNMPLISSLTNQYANRVSDVGGGISIGRKIGDDQISLGIATVSHDIEFSFSADNNRRFEINPSGKETALYGLYDWKIDDRWQLNLGGRLNHYSGTDELYFGPRLSSTYQANDQIRFKGSYAKHYQFLREVTHYTRLREPIETFLMTSDKSKGRTYPVGTSTTAMVGATMQKDNWTIDLEIYNKQLEGVIEHTELVVGFNPDDPKPPAREYEAIIGNGKSIGADLSIGFQNKQYTSWLAYTLSKTTNQFKELFKNAAVPSEDDRRHQLKFANQYEWGNWSLTGNYIFASGKSQLNLFDQETKIDFQNGLQDNSYARLPSYHRVDLGIGYKINLGGSKATVGLSVFNLTNNQNVDYTQYLFAIPRKNRNRDLTVLSGTTSSLLDRTLNLSFKLDW